MYLEIIKEALGNNHTSDNVTINDTLETKLLVYNFGKTRLSDCFLASPILAKFRENLASFMQNMAECQSVNKYEALISNAESTCGKYEVKTECTNYDK